MSREPVDLAAALIADPYMGLRLSLAKPILLTDRPHDTWAIWVEQRHLTRAGNEGRPTKVVTLIGHDGETPSNLLRTLANMLEQGIVPWSEADHAR